MTTEAAPRNEYLDNMPIKRLGRPEEIAAAVRFLSRPDAAWITGVKLAV
ncbi:MAG: SDR family oxidoreductase [Actinomycetota bacterium]